MDTGQHTDTFVVADENGMHHIVKKYIKYEPSEQEPVLYELARNRKTIKRIDGDEFICPKTKVRYFIDRV